MLETEYYDQKRVINSLGEDKTNEISLFETRPGKIFGTQV
jgi:hypothetical protein